jgi:hypothetical protein
VIAERLTAAIEEIDRKIDLIKARAASEVKDLEKRKLILLQVQSQITPQIEQAVKMLESIGVVVVGKG